MDNVGYENTPHSSTAAEQNEELKKFLAVQAAMQHSAGTPTLPEPSSSSTTMPLAYINSAEQRALHEAEAERAAATEKETLLVATAAMMKERVKLESLYMAKHGGNTSWYADVDEVGNLQPETETRTNFKLVIVGDSGVGKSTMLSYFANEDNDAVLGGCSGGNKPPKPSKTFYVSLATKTIRLAAHNVDVMLEIWDTAGNAHVRDATYRFYRNADGFIIVFNRFQKLSYMNVFDWAAKIREFCNAENFPVTVVGFDFATTNQENGGPEVSSEEGRRMAAEIGAEYFECSASSSNVSKDVKNIFVQLSERMFLRKLQNRRSRVASTENLCTEL